MFVVLVLVVLLLRCCLLLLVSFLVEQDFLFRGSHVGSLVKVLKEADGHSTAVLFYFVCCMFPAPFEFLQGMLKVTHNVPVFWLFGGERP